MGQHSPSRKTSSPQLQKGTSHCTNEQSGGGGGPQVGQHSPFRVTSSSSMQRGGGQRTY